MDSSGAEAMAAGLGVGVLIFYILLLVFFIIVMWKLYEKAGEPGWASIVPIYGALVLFKIAGKPMWWFLLLFIPIVNFVILIMTYHGLSKSFGKDAGFTVGLLLLGIVFFPILAFGPAQYVGPGGAGGGATSDPEVLDQGV